MIFYKVISIPSTTVPAITTSSNVSISGDTLTIELTDPCFTAAKTFSLATLISQLGQDHGCIAISYVPSINNIIANETTQLTLAEKAAYTSSDATKQFSGSPFSAVATRLNGFPYLYILTPTANCSADDLIVILQDTTAPAVNPKTSEDINVVATLSYEGVTQDPELLASTLGFLDSWNKMSITGPSTMPAGSTQAFTISAPAGATAYLSSDIGVINRARATNGQTFILDTAGLAAGEVVTIKAGYKFWSGSAKVQVTLS